MYLTVDTSFSFTKKANFAKCFFDICNDKFAQWCRKIMKFGHSKLIFYSKKHPNLSKLFFMKGNQFRTNFFFTFFVTKMTSNFWQQCAIAALEISKNILQNLIFLWKWSLYQLWNTQTTLSKSLGPLRWELETFGFLRT